MNELDPIVFRDTLSTTLARFISTASPVSSTRAPRLAQKITRELNSSTVSLVKGPFVESLPDFEKKQSLKELVDQGRLSPKWSALSDRPDGAKLYTRPLHKHQAEAVTRDGENYLVATGSGSGKTEAFLYPLIDDLLKEDDLS